VALSVVCWPGCSIYGTAPARHAGKATQDLPAGWPTLHAVDPEPLQCWHAPYNPRHPAPRCAQATANGFGLVNEDNVFRVCDQPHPILVGAIVRHCQEARIDDAYEGLKVLPAAALRPLPLRRLGWRRPNPGAFLPECWWLL
jgi:hypothetical protein